MDGQIAFYSLGTVEVKIGNESVGDFISSKVPALLYYLVANPGEHNRKELASKLWSHMPEKDSAANLRNVLSNARKKVGDNIQVNGQFISFNHDADYWFDVTEIANLGDFPLEQSTVYHWQETLDLYRGDFLAGFEPRSAEVFVEWIRAQQAVIRVQYIQRMLELGRYYLETEDYERGLIIAKRLLALEPWHEPAYRLSMRLFAASGQRNAALAQYEICHAMLWKELGVEPESKTKTLYNLLLANRPQIPNNLWAKTRTCIGRKDEIQYVHKLLQADDSRFLTILGPGGVGKTMLALQVARNLLKPTLLEPQFQDGIFIVTLSRVTLSRVYSEVADRSDRNAVVIAIGNEIGVDFFPNQSVHTQLLNWLRDKNLLLILNNFEQLLAGSEYVGLINDILHTAPNVKLLVTSRQRLMLRAESIFMLNGLSTSVNKDKPDYSEAAKLFIERGRVNVPNFEPTPDDIEAINRICKLSDGLPLAIELAAGWLGTLTCAEIAKELSGGLDLLSTEIHDMPPRHRDMRAVFDYSWKLLSEQEQQCLLHLSIFRFNFSYAAALEISSAKLPLIQQLVNKSWLQSSEKIFTFQLLIHEYLQEKRVADPAIDQETHMRHGVYYASMLQSILADLRGGNGVEALAQISADLDSILIAHLWVAEQKMSDMVASMIEPLAIYFGETGTDFVGAEHFKTLGNALDANSEISLYAPVRALELYFSRERMPPAEFLVSVKEILPHLDANEHPTTLGKLYYAATLSCFYQNALDEAHTFAVKSFESLNKAAEYQHHTSHLDALATTYATRGNFEEARATIQKAVSINRARNYSFGLAASLSTRAFVAMCEGDLETSAICFRESADLYQRIGNIHASPIPLSGLSRSLIRLGRLDEVPEILKQCLHAAQTSSVQLHMQLSLLIWARLLNAQNQFSEARLVAVSLIDGATRDGRIANQASSLLQQLPDAPCPEPRTFSELSVRMSTWLEQRTS